jgi:Lrp/AsnC family transcriptional regulator for asnA, asnC and gidA
MNALQDVAGALEALPQTRYVGYSTGPYDLIIEVVFRSHEELLELLSRGLSRIPGISKTDTSVILKVTKFAYEWEVPDDTVKLPGGETAPRPGA